VTELRRWRDVQHKAIDALLRWVLTMSMARESLGAADVIEFWFSELSASDWWKKDPALDRRIAQTFGAVHAAAVRAELFHWRANAEGRLAEVLVLDQFSRNIHRDTPASFAADPLALALAQEAVSRGADRELEPKRRSFLFMPYMHSESRAIHVEGERLFRGVDKNNHDFELKHKAIIDRFGRYPHRNAILGRESTPEELEFLKSPASSF
jgi:uncharacterized protein (DUF924 family)